jgi:hypothetical protein
MVSHFEHTVSFKHRWSPLQDSSSAYQGAGESVLMQSYSFCAAVGQVGWVVWLDTLGSWTVCISVYVSRSCMCVHINVLVLHKVWSFCDKLMHWNFLGDQLHQTWVGHETHFLVISSVSLHLQVWCGEWSQLISGMVTVMFLLSWCMGQMRNRCGWLNCIYISAAYWRSLLLPWRLKQLVSEALVLSHLRWGWWPKKILSQVSRLACLLCGWYSCSMNTL